jgi:caffeoyl-CoA O-methyltransferase
MTMNQARKEYIRAVLGQRDPVLDQILRHALLEKHLQPIQIDDNAGRILQMLTLIHKPRFVIEIGSLFGYSTVHIARGLPPASRIVSLEIDAEAAEIARHSLVLAGVSDKVDIIHGDALDYVATLDDNFVDMVFIDGAKKSYPNFLKGIVRKIRSGGLVIADDAFADGLFKEDSDQVDNDAQLRGIHTYNKAMGKASTFFSTFIATETGFMVSVKK